MARQVTKVKKLVNGKLKTISKTVKTNVAKNTNLSPKQMKIEADKQVRLGRTAAISSNISQGLLELGQLVKRNTTNPTINVNKDGLNNLVDGGLTNSSTSRDDDDGGSNNMVN